MSKVKKILAVVLSMAMIMGMSITSFAATITTPSTADQAAIKVTNVPEGATVTAYQVVEAKYDGANGFEGYKTVAGVTIAKPEAPTSEEVTEIANGITNGTITGLATKTLLYADGAYTANAEAGYWVIIVDNTASTIYNPMLAGVYYTNENGNVINGGTADANTKWNLDGTEMYAKSSDKPTIDKSIVDSENNKNGDSVAYGDKVKFQIDSKIPSYSNEYKDLVYTISDKISTGLTYTTPSDIAVTVGGTTVAASADTFTVTQDGQEFSVAFAESYIRANGGKAVAVTYSATVNNNAPVNFVPNTNDATLEYTNDPTSTTDKISDTTYNYTFAINANLFGTNGEQWNKITDLLTKTGAERTYTIGDVTYTDTTLPGATFTLTNNETDKVYTATSGEDGSLSFAGLDEGTYTLVETIAPADYSLNTREIPVVIEADYNTNGTLAKVTYTIDGKATSTFKASYKGETTTITTIDPVIVETALPNTKLSSLPSTGGIGTTIFTIGGCVIMIGAAFLYFRSRKKVQK